MRNLTTNSFHYDSPAFLAILAELNINICHIKHARVLRRFFQGVKQKPMETPVREQINTVTTVRHPFSNLGEMQNKGAAQVDEYFDRLKNNVLEALVEKDIAYDSITGITFEDDWENQGEFSGFEITHLSPEKEEDFLAKKNYATAYNLLLSSRETIYARVDAISSEAHKKEEKARALRDQIERLSAELKDVEKEIEA
jgi:hypothetical protein